MFKDGNSIKYDATNAKFDTVLFGTYNPGNPISGVLETATPYTPMDFTTTFAKKVDNSVVGNMMDCGECHVGGGMMEYMPSGYTAPGTVQTSVAYDPAKRVSLREAVFGTAVTAFNWFIDVFGADGLGYEPHNHDGSTRDVEANKPTYAPVAMNYATSGVMEMDCLICHKNDYSWEKRKEAVRTGKFDASRAYGAGFAKSVVNGTQVFYNSTSVKKNTAGQLTVNLSTVLSGQPSSNNCASCHMGTEEHKYQVEWKKRGEMWVPGKEVHMGIGCMGCHERKDIGTVGTTSDTGVGKTGIASGAAANAKLGLCDPAKGKASPYEAMWNAVDGKQFKECKDCHATTTSTGTSSTYGAPNPDARHAAFGLMSSANGGKIAFLADGTPASHLDIIDCTACHIRKSGFSGGAFVDGTGVDLEGRLATHDTENVAREHNNDGIAPHWLGGKIYAGNLLTSFFWRDMSSLNTANGGFDANLDGREGGMDPFLPTHIAKINAATNTKAIFETRPTNAAVITNNQNQILANIEAELGIATGTYLATNPLKNPIIPKLSFLVVPFKASHNIAPATQAWGAKGCKECHADNAGFYNGQYPINGKQAKQNADGTYKRVNSAADTDFTFNSNQVGIYTKVNGLSDNTDTHPNVVNKKGTRSVPVQFLSKFDMAYTGSVTPDQYLRDIDRSEMLYESTFQTRNTDWYDSITGGAIVPACTVDWDATNGNKPSPFYCDPTTVVTSTPGAVNVTTGAIGGKHVVTGTKGWLLKVEVDTDPTVTTDAIVTRTVQVMNDKVTSTDELVAALGSVGGDPVTGYFTVANVGGALSLTAIAPNKIRLGEQTDVAPLGLKGKLWKADPIVRGANSYATRTAYLAYLNSIGNAPTAQIAKVGNTDVTGDPKTGLPGVTLAKGIIQFEATPDANPDVTYTWTFSDLPLTDPVTGASNIKTGATVQRTINTATSFYANLQVKNNNTGEVKTDKQYVKITATAPVLASVVGAITTTDSVTTVPVTVTDLHTRIYVKWGDGTEQSYMDNSTATLNLTHKYYGATPGQTFNASVKVLNGGTVVGIQTVTVTPVPL